MRVMRHAIVTTTRKRVLITDETHAWYIDEDGNIYKPQEIDFTHERQDIL